MTGYESKRAAAQDKLAQPAQEPVVFCMHWQDRWGCNHYVDPKEPHPENAKPLYTAQPAQEPVAWMNKHGDCKSAVFREAEAGAKEEYNIPLYTNQTLEKK